MLFINHCLAFNNIVPSKLINKLRDLGLNTTLCDWILNFLTGRQAVWISGQLIIGPGDCFYNYWNHDLETRQQSFHSPLGIANVIVLFLRTTGKSAFPCVKICQTLHTGPVVCQNSSAGIVYSLS